MCAGCGHLLGGRTAFELHTDQGSVLKCLACAVRHAPMLARSARIALIVGTLLTAINHGDVIVGGHWMAAMIWKIPLTYATPFAVATWGALSNSRAQIPR
jgi:hypothetical protein